MKRETWKRGRTLTLGVACFACLAARASAQSIDASAYEPLPPYGPRTVLPGYPSYYFVSWKQAPSEVTTTIQEYSIVSAPKDWSVSLPDLEKTKGKGGQLKPVFGAIVKITPPADSGTLAPNHREIVIRMKRNGVTLEQTLAVSLLDQYPTTRTFAPLSHNPRLFWDHLRSYEENFVKYAAQYGSAAYCQKTGTWDGGTWYYDGGRVFFQWADYSGNKSWYRYAANPLEIYRAYAQKNAGSLPGWRVFTEGLKQDFLRNGREDSRDLALAIAKKAAYHPVTTPFDYLRDAGRIREVSYAVDSYLDAMDLGDPEHPHLKPYVDILIGYIQVMCVDQSELYVQPFMLALCTEALTKYYKKYKDPRIPGTIVAIANFCMNKAWVNSEQSWWYESYPGGNTAASPPNPHRGAPDLNLLILPIFSWLYWQTKDVAYLDVCDHAFAAGTKQAWIGNGKHFSQNYRWSLDYVIPRKRIRDWPRTGRVPLQRAVRRP